MLRIKNDKNLGESLTNPKSQLGPLNHWVSRRAGRIHKTYGAKINKLVSPIASEKLKDGIFIEHNLKTLPAKVNIMNETRTEIMSAKVEGKNRRARNKFESLAYIEING